MIPPFDLQRHPLAIRRVELARVEQLSPRMRRLVFTGPELVGFVSLAPEDHVKLFFPEPGSSELALPTLSAQGRIQPPAKGTPIARDYTPRSWDPEANELAIDFYLHGDGVASRWAAGAEAGAELGLAGPRGSFILRESFDWHLFVADETALPEVGRRVDEMTASERAILIAQVDDASEERPPSVSDRLQIHWARRSEGARAIDRLRDLELPDGRGFVWLAGEASEVKEVKAHLLLERGLPKAVVRSSGHWKRGVVNHDHHEPIEVEGT
ncbi:MAG: siderophore-interacting protein [Deltaproteobacteria bacterium]|nr:siderophore-interacting protein [Deltaproteobacteria bacterium]